MLKEFDNLRKAIKQQLINSGKSESDAENQSWDIATKNWKESHNGNAPSRENYDQESYDSEGRFIVAENAKLYIEAGISQIEE